MSNSNVYTEDFSEIVSNSRERALAIEILQAWGKHGLPIDFYEGGAKLAFNRNSGDVFLVNDNYDVCMMNGDKLESFYISPYSGHEGFINDLLQSYNDGLDSWHEEDIEWLNDIAGNLE